MCRFFSDGVGGVKKNTLGFWEGIFPDFLFSYGELGGADAEWHGIPESVRCGASFARRN